MMCTISIIYVGLPSVDNIWLKYPQNELHSSVFASSPEHDIIFFWSLHSLLGRTAGSDFLFWRKFNIYLRLGVRAIIIWYGKRCYLFHAPVTLPVTMQDSSTHCRCHYELYSSFRESMLLAITGPARDHTVRAVFPLKSQYARRKWQSTKGNLSVSFPVHFAFTRSSTSQR